MVETGSLAFGHWPTAGRCRNRGEAEGAGCRERDGASPASNESTEHREQGRMRTRTAPHRP